MVIARNIRHRNSRRRGSALAIVLATVVVLLGMVVAMVDVGYLAAVKSRVQSTADAASMAGVLRLRAEYEDPIVSDTNAMAIKFAELNEPSTIVILASSDIEIGLWDDASEAFIGGTDGANAVRVTVRRSSDQSHSVTLFLVNAFGRHLADLNVTSVCTFNVMQDEDGNDEMSQPYLRAVNPGQLLFPNSV